MIRTPSIGIYHKNPNQSYLTKINYKNQEIFTYKYRAIGIVSRDSMGLLSTNSGGMSQQLDCLALLAHTGHALTGSPSRVFYGTPYRNINVFRRIFTMVVYEKNIWKHK